ncbi:MAG TPA: MogA/MoaB family molybdenum cofactor biosynthesis protein [Thermomicrobiales bacterium]|nr:MogA/MoaB family molybdenum cofactor biosynthesis protein [Thermomicrobiales bacterium]
MNDPSNRLPQSPADEHRDEAPDNACIAVLTMSDTRTREEDHSGEIVRQGLIWRGFTVAAYEIVPDDPNQIREQIAAWLADGTVDAIITNGGTGISSRDSTFEVVDALLEKRLDGFGELFRMLSWQEIGAAAMLSRAIAGSVGSKAIFCLPGSSNGVKLAMEKLIGPELGHVIHELRKHR